MKYANALTHAVPLIDSGRITGDREVMPRADKLCSSIDEMGSTTSTSP